METKYEEYGIGKISLNKIFYIHMALMGVVVVVMIIFDLFSGVGIGILFALFFIPMAIIFALKNLENKKKEKEQQQDEKVYPHVAVETEQSDDA